MWNLIRSFFGGRAKPSEKFEDVKAEVDQVLRLDLATDADREANGELVLKVLMRLDSEIERVRQGANGYPAKPISALVWMNGAGYASQACALTQHFRTAGWLEREENASGLWAKATLAVCSHYHHMVGPAMLANADCHDRLGNTARSTGMYSGVVQDFAFLADDYSVETEPPGAEDRLALESLQTATERLLSRGCEQVGEIKLSLLQERVAKVLSRPGGE